MNARQLYDLGMQYAAQQDFVRAQQYIEAAVAAGYPETAAMMRLVEISLAASQIQAALHRLQQHLQRHPNDWRLRFLLATLYVTDGQLEPATNEARALTEQLPQRAEGHYLLAMLLRDQGEIREANRYFHSYLALSPQGEHAPEARAALRRKVR